MKWSNVYRMRLFLVGFVTISVLGGRSAKADFTFGEPTNLGPVVNSSSDWNCHPSITRDGLSLFFTSDRPGGSGAYDLWVTTRTTIDDPWTEPANLGPTVNTSGDDWAQSISGDGLSLYFMSDRPGGEGEYDIWLTTRKTTFDVWVPPVNLGPPVNSSYVDANPSISTDGLELYFASNRPGGSGDKDLWVSTRATADNPWRDPVNLGPVVNSGSNENYPDISADDLLLFFGSKRPGGLGQRDLWMTGRATKDEPWGTPVNLGATINTSGQEAAPNISADGSTLYVMTDWPGSFGVVDIWQVSITPIVDFNGDGIIDSADRGIMMDHWGEDYSLCDIGPMPWGDGIVDIQDLLVLVDYLEPIDTLIAHWALDETEGITAHDSVSGNDDIIMGDPLWQPTGGKVDGALELDGVTNCIIPTTGPNPAEGPFSIFAWIKGGAPGQVIISQPLGSNWLGVDADGMLMTELKASGSGPPILLSQAVITDDQWHHIGLVWDGSQRMLCADGVVVAEDTPDGLEPSAGGLYIGVGNNWAAGSFFSGLIDDVRIYRQALSAEDIAALAQ